MAPDSGTPISDEHEQDTLTRRRRKRVLIAIAVAVAIVIGALILIRHHESASADSKRRSDANRAIPVRAVAATTGNVDRTIDALGTVAALNTVTVRSRVDGPLIEVPFHEGELVHGGDLLARIDPRTFQVALDQAVGVLGHDQSQLADARIDLNRYTGLLAKDSIAKQTVDSQVYTVKQLQGTVRSDQATVENARLQLDFTRITAPFPGRVGLRQIDVGNMVHATDTTGIVLLTQTHPITVVFAVPSDQIPQIVPHWRNGDELAVDALDRDGKVQAHGQVSAIDNQIDTTTGTVKLKAQFANADDALFPAEFVNARLKIETLTGVTLVPTAAVQRGAPGTFVYVVNADNTVGLRKVTTGPASGDLVSIPTGIKPGEQVVIDGLDKLRDGAKVSVIQPGNNPAPAQTAPQRGKGTATGKKNSAADGKAAP
jgi:multidrug efflux system membrane fusion protein